MRRCVLPVSRLCTFPFSSLWRFSRTLPYWSPPAAQTVVASTAAAASSAEHKRAGPRSRSVSAAKLAAYASEHVLLVLFNPHSLCDQLPYVRCSALP